MDNYIELLKTFGVTQDNINRFKALNKKQQKEVIKEFKLKMNEIDDGFCLECNKKATESCQFH